MCQSVTLAVVVVRVLYAKVIPPLPLFIAKCNTSRAVTQSVEWMTVGNKEYISPPPPPTLIVLIQLLLFPGLFAFCSPFDKANKEEGIITRFKWSRGRNGDEEAFDQRKLFIAPFLQIRASLNLQTIKWGRQKKVLWISLAVRYHMGLRSGGGWGQECGTW